MLMDDWQLSPDLEQLERALSGRWRPQPSVGLGQRVLGEVRAQLRRERPRSRWRFAVAVAAAVLVWLNLSFSATHATDYGLRRSGQGETLEATSARIRQLLPELSEQEARQQAALLRAGANLVCLPNVCVSRGIGDLELETGD
jgi:hypothetical protein